MQITALNEKEEKNAFFGKGTQIFYIQGKIVLEEDGKFPFYARGEGDRPRYTLMIEPSMLFSWAAGKKRTKEYHVNQITVGIVRSSSLGTGFKKRTREHVNGSL